MLPIPKEQNMFNADLVTQYIDIIKSDPDKYAADYRTMMEKVKTSRAIYKGQPIPMTYQGMFFSPEDKAFMEAVSSTAMEIGRRVVQKYIQDPEYRKLFGYEKRLEDLILHDPGYDVPVPICRYDIFLNSHDDFKFCEFNTDGASAMNEENTLGQILLETQGFEAFGQKYHLENPELFASWVEAITGIYARARPGAAKPNVAIVDLLDRGTSAEFEVFKETFEAKGYACSISDVRKLTYKDGALYDGDFKIDLVYRRLVTQDLMEVYDQISDFIQAYFDNAFVCVGSLRSQVMHTKLIYKILRLPETQAILTEDQNAFVRDHIPYTETFETQADYDLVLKDKDAYILKPNDGYASQGVYAGREHSQEEWEAILKKILATGYIYQEYFDMDKVDFVEFDDQDQLTVTGFSGVIGMFIYDEKHMGMYTRIGNEALISGARRYYTTPNFICTPK